MYPRLVSCDPLAPRSCLYKCVQAKVSNCLSLSFVSGFWEGVFGLFVIWLALEIKPQEC